MKRVIKNLGLLDIRNATEEIIKSIEKINNLGTVVYSKNTASLLSGLNIGNLGSSVELPEDCKVHMGKITLSGELLKTYKEPVSMAVIGKLIIPEGVTKEDIEGKFGKIYVVGKLLCSEEILSVIQPFITVTGKIQIYKEGEGEKIVTGVLEVNNSFLASLKEKTILTVTGKIKMTGEIDMELFKEKIGELNISGKLLAKEEYMEVIYSKMKNGMECKIDIIPEGYLYIEDELDLDGISIKKFEKAKIYTKQPVKFAKDISPEKLAGHIKALKADDIIICPETLREAVISISDRLNPKIISYSGRLVEIENEYTLTPSELEYTPEKLTYIVRGRLEIEKDIEPHIIMEKVEHFHNFGEIVTDSKQIGPVSLLMKTREGEIIQRDKQKEGNDTVIIGNAGSLSL